MLALTLEELALTLAIIRDFDELDDFQTVDLYAKFARLAALLDLKDLEI